MRLNRTNLITAALLGLSALGSTLAYASVFGSVPFGLFWGWVTVATVPAAYVANLRASAWAKLPLTLAALWCMYLAVGSGATYL